ncbi:uncharacterized protein LOC143295961 [Babylonia areolata]|uniref:uncharacterized protein LOC143295961 n=1 Tax=Babylonia areolata TaxID=304850 RepID=UPI003FD4F330
MASTHAVSLSDMDSHVESAVQRGDWTALQQLMESGQLTDQQTSRVIVEVIKHGDGQQFSQHVLPFCSRAQLYSAMAELISTGLWVPVYNLSLYAGQEHSEWQVGPLSLKNHLLAVVAKGRWTELGALLQNDSCVSAAQKQWALLHASQRAPQLDIIQNVLSQCADQDLDRVLKELVSRGLWWAVGSLFSQRHAVSATQKTWAIEKAAKEATTWELSDFIFHHCSKRQLASVSKVLVTRRLWWSLVLLLKKDVPWFSEFVLPACGNADTDLFMSHLLSVGDWKSVQKLLAVVGARKRQWKIEDFSIHDKLIQLAADGKWVALAGEVYEKHNKSVLKWVLKMMSQAAAENEIFTIVVHMCPLRQIPSVVLNLVKRGFMKDAARLLCRLIGEMMEIWAGVRNPDESDGEPILYLLRELYIELSFEMKTGVGLVMKVHEEKPLYGSIRLISKLVWDNLSIFQVFAAATSEQLLCTLLFNSAIMATVLSLFDIQDKQKLYLHCDTQVHETMKKILREMRGATSSLPQSVRRLCVEFKGTFTNNSTSNPVFVLSFVCAVMRHCYCQGRWSDDTHYFLSILTTVPVVPEMQREALKIMLRENKWRIICMADLTYVGEQVRRMTFSSAVRSKQWDLVKQWADHTLSDDQRSWAMKKACKEKRWDVCLRLAEHGLTEDEVTHVHYLVAMNADWEVVLNLYKHESDVGEVNSLLSKGKLQMVEVEEKQEQERSRRINELANLETQLKSRMMSMETLELAVTQGDWQVVVFTVRQKPTADNVSMALKAAVASKAWSVVTELFRMGIQMFDQHPSFLEMIINHQWGVCRVIIEQGLNTDQYKDAIPTLMEQNQWILVGKMMDYIDDDAVRRHIMQCALQRNEGSVASQCILGMTQELSIQEREFLFQRAVITDTLQAVTPLVTEKDDTGVRHRDIALQQAVSQQQWDIVDLCLKHHADINMSVDGGDSLIQRAAQRDDWHTVMALAKRGGDPSLLDNTGMSVLHRAIGKEEWTCVTLLMVFSSTPHQSATHKDEERTALEMLIAADREDIITYALSQNTAQWKGVNRRGETALHMMCLYGMHNNIRPVLLHGVHPLSVTHRGHSVLSYAVLSDVQPTRMVAECISLGFSTHQPHITQAMQTRHKSFLSPVLLAVMRGLPGTTRMLYESGSCSLSELFLALPKLLPLTDPHSVRTCSLMNEFLVETEMTHTVISQPSKWENVIKEATQYLMAVSTTPRSLKSACRLVISHSLKVSPARDRDVSQLPVSSVMKDYILFSDLTGPDFGRSGDNKHDQMGTVGEEDW